jgi:hypothetical protein
VPPRSRRGGDTDPGDGDQHTGRCAGEDLGELVVAHHQFASERLERGDLPCQQALRCSLLARGQAQGVPGGGENLVGLGAQHASTVGRGVRDEALDVHRGELAGPVDGGKEHPQGSVSRTQS